MATNTQRKEDYCPWWLGDFLLLHYYPGGNEEVKKAVDDPSVAMYDVPASLAIRLVGPTPCPVVTVVVVVVTARRYLVPHAQRWVLIRPRKPSWTLEHHPLQQPAQVDDDDDAWEHSR